jgi:hypothetical protein
MMVDIIVIKVGKTNINHPPVITMFLLLVCKPFPGKWVKMALFYPHE